MACYRKYRSSHSTQIIMFSLFKRIKTDRKLVVFIISQWTKLNRKWTYAMLLLFIASYGLLSLHTIWSAFDAKGETKIIIAPIRNLEAVGKSELSAKEDRKNIDRSQLKNLNNYTCLIDSLKINAPQTYDSIQRFRPGLLDSLHLLESILK